MKQLGLASQDAMAVAKAERNRRFPWCRLWNGFLDLPIFRVVAERLGMPLYQVQAFAARLEGFANRGEPRGYVGDFSAAEFGVALGMSADDAARIYAVLEEADILWIDQDHVGGFWDRNRDREDNTQAVRQQRKRDRHRVRKLLADLARKGLITVEQRDGVEAMLELMADDDLTRFLASLRRGMALEPALSTCHSVTAVTSGLRWMRQGDVDNAGENGLSTGHACHTVTHRDTVTVTPRPDHKFISAAVDNSGDGASGESAGLPKEDGAAVPQLSDVEAAELYLATKGKRVLVERLDELPTRVDTRLERWRQLVGDDVRVLAQIIDRASMSDLTVARFLTAITEAIERHRREATTPQLKLGPTLAADNRRRGHG